MNERLELLAVFLTQPAVKVVILESMNGNVAPMDEAVNPTGIVGMLKKGNVAVSVGFLEGKVKTCGEERGHFGLQFGFNLLGDTKVKFNMGFVHPISSKFFYKPHGYSRTRGSETEVVCVGGGLEGRWV